MCKDARLHQQ